MAQIHHFAFGGKIGKIEQLLKEDPRLVMARDSVKDTPLHYAGRGGRASAAELLVKHGAKLGAKNQNGETALHCAARAGSVACVKMLISLGAGLEVKNSDGDTPLQVGASQGEHSGQRERLVKCFLDHGARYDILSAVTVNDVNRVREILAKRPALLSEWQKTDLARLMAWGTQSAEMTRLLLEHGVSPNVKARLFRDPPIFHADRAALEVLLEHGANVNATNFQGKTLLHYARLGQDRDLEKLLKRYGARLAGGKSSRKKRATKSAGKSK